MDGRLDGRQAAISDRRPVVVIGAGIAGLVAAFELANRGVPTVVVETADRPGGKMRRTELGRYAFDAGPTVLTMRWVFDELFAQAGLSFSDWVPTRAAAILARHAWEGDARLDLHADVERSTDEIARFAGAGEGRRFRSFCDEARATYRALEHSFIRDQRPSVAGLARRIAARRPADLFAIRPFSTLWRALGRHFHDPRLRQLFGRYATYCGSSPFDAPATLMLVAHVEQDGVWLVEPGMFRIAEVLEQLARRRGAGFRYGCAATRIGVDNGGVCEVELASGEIQPAGAVVVNADAAGLAQGVLGPVAARAARGADRLPRSLSAITWLVAARTSGFPLSRHNVFFSRNYRDEFEALFHSRTLPGEPTIYVCAQDRGADGTAGGSGCVEGATRAAGGQERLFCLINAPAGTVDRVSTAFAEGQVFGALERFGLRIERAEGSTRMTTPDQFARLYPGSGGALYGSATHGWSASFRRPRAASVIPGLFLAGGSAHPGPGVPMAALSGRLAAQGVLARLGAAP
jgi:1-hydroxycarotenoid 3,4-desaturase